MHEKGTIYREFYIYEYYTTLDRARLRFNFETRQFVHKQLIIKIITFVCMSILRLFVGFETPHNIHV